MARSALGPGGSTTAWRRIRAHVLARDGYRCRRPINGVEHGIELTTHDQRAPSHATVGHIVRRIDDPLNPDRLDNLRAECAHCNYGDGAAYTNGRALVDRVNASRRW